MSVSTATTATATAKPSRQAKAGVPNTFALSPDRKFEILVQGRMGYVDNTRHPQNCREFVSVMPERKNHIFYDPTSRFAYVGAHGRFRVLELGEKCRDLGWIKTALSPEIEKGSVSPDGRLLAVLTRTRTVEVWDREDERLALLRPIDPALGRVFKFSFDDRGVLNLKFATQLSREFGPGQFYQNH